LDITLVGHYGHSQSRGFNFCVYLHYSGHQAAGGSKAPPVLDFLGVAALLPGINVNNNNTHYNSPVNSGAHITDKDFSAVR